MSLFDLLFIALVLASVVILSSAAILALIGRRARAMATLRGYAIGAAVYLGVVILVSLAAPRRVLRVGEPLRFDDWCITVEGAERTASPSEVSYVVRLRLASLARGVTQRENGLAIYLTDDQGSRYDPVADVTAVPFSVPLGPMESVIATRTFKVPPNTPVSGLVIAHEGGFPINWFIIGGGPFRKEPIVRLDGEGTR
jgi:hypothetical protein